MQESIQPKYGKMTATCSCGAVIETRSTMAKEIVIDVCSLCHPFYTGKQKSVDTGGRIDRFNKRFTGRRAS
jgi:large subunit ribosomal protein L31